MLLPALNVAREKARGAACMSNLKQMGTIFIMYAQDYNGNTPIGRGYGIGLNPSPYELWPYVLHNYASYVGWITPGSNIIICPSDRGRIEILTISYIYNARIGGDELYSCPPHKLLSVRYPSRTILLIDDGQPVYQSYYCHMFYSVCTCTRHSGGANVLFVDNHVEWYNFEKDPPAHGSTEYKDITWLVE